MSAPAPLPPATTRRLAPLLWQAPDEPVIQATIEVQAERLLEWLDLQERISGVAVAPQHAIVRALAMVLQHRIELNGTVHNGRFRAAPHVHIYLRHAIGTLGAAETRGAPGILIEQAAQRSVLDVGRQWAAANAQDPASIPSPRLTGWPAFLLRPVLRLATRLWERWGWRLGLPWTSFGAAMIVPMGSTGIQLHLPPFAPLTRYALVVVAGPVEERPVAQDGVLLIQRMMNLYVSFDHRLADGETASMVALELKHLLENPRTLQTADQFTGEMPRLDTETELELPDPIPTEELMHGA